MLSFLRDGTGEYGGGRVFEVRWETTASQRIGLRHRRESLGWRCGSSTVVSPPLPAAALQGSLTMETAI